MTFSTKSEKIQEHFIKISENRDEILNVFFFRATGWEAIEEKTKHQPVMLGRENGLWRLLP